MKSSVGATLELGIMMSLIASIVAVSSGQELANQDSDLKIAYPAFTKKRPKARGEFKRRRWDV